MFEMNLHKRAPYPRYTIDMSSTTEWSGVGDSRDLWVNEGLSTNLAQFTDPFLPKLDGDLNPEPKEQLTRRASVAVGQSKFVLRHLYFVDGI